MFENTLNTASAVYGYMFTHEFTRESNYSFFHGFLSDSVEITSSVYTKTIIHLRLN